MNIVVAVALAFGVFVAGKTTFVNVKFVICYILEKQNLLVTEK